MLSIKDYKNSKDFGKAVGEELIINYSVDIELKPFADFNAMYFLDGLFRKSNNYKLYYRVLDSLNVINCHPTCFDNLVDNMRIYIEPLLGNNLVKDSFNRFIERNKPFTITDLIKYRYKVSVSDGVDIKNISYFTYDDFTLTLHEGDTPFDYNSIKTELYNRQVIYYQTKTISRLEVDHSSEQIYLYY